MEYFNIYNKYGEKTDGIIERGEAHKRGIYHRVAHLWILNRRNELLIQQRSADKDAGAGFWYVSVGGHIDASESVESTLIRETKEELGLDISNLTDSLTYLYTFIDHVTINNGGYIDNEFYDVFVLKADFDIDRITMQADEVQAVKYIKYEDFKKIVIERDKSFWQHKVGYKMLLAALDDFLGLQ
ncbi:MAG: NUDIX domain-containing protein [Defluviitaleaceae bacterium]|nr:NUDIX domain-containing protein [Defluviitaleaceae bacterium]MCL2835161.1 NUDIX domain-containing protein [Defluviitaleaceae bacterium]